VAGLLDLPRAEVQRAIVAGRIRVDGELRQKSYVLAGGESVSVDLDGALEIHPEDPAVPIRYEDAHLMIVAKPPGIPTHPTSSRRSGTLVNRLLGMGHPLSTSAGPLRPGIVHRLDRGTSGLLIVAKDDATHALLADLLSRHLVKRTYLALVRGPVEHDRFTVEAPLGRTGARVRVRRGAGRAAETDLEVIERFDRATLLEARPRTGRTHQIRVHLQAIGHPILGDARYGGGGDVAAGLGLARPFLHAARLSFEHPVTGRRIEVEEPLPDELISVLGRLRAGRPGPGPQPAT
jgi:23S rRNA pseudouridine1911/1915/1917 synthase